jgi:hypothetical protein
VSDINANAIRDFLGSFGAAKGHLKNSQREFLLAFREVFSVFAMLSENSNIEVLGLPAHVMRGLVGLVDYLIAQIPESGGDTDVSELKRKALEELIEVLEIEIERSVKEASTQADLAKVEALQGLIKYIKAEYETVGKDAPAGKKKRRISKIEVE